MKAEEARKLTEVEVSRQDYINIKIRNAARDSQLSVMLELTQLEIANLRSAGFNVLDNCNESLGVVRVSWEQ